MTSSIFESCRRRRDAEEHRRQARAERMALVAAEMGATSCGVGLWELRCDCCNMRFLLSAEAYVDGFAECQTYRDIRRIVATAKKECSHDALRRMISEAKGEADAP
ncbi:MAG: hypothetical protein WBB98_08040 [Xanthobacteraceae bacterium]